MSSTLKQRKQKSNKKRKKRNAKQISSPIQKNKKSTNTVRPYALIFRLIIGSICLISLYAFKYYYSSHNNINNGDTNNVSVVEDKEDIDFTKIINSADLNLSQTKLRKMSPRFKKMKMKKVPTLKLWSIEDFWTEDIAVNISNQLYNEFMDESLRNQNFYFTVNNGNEKIRGNDNIEEKTQNAKEKLSRNMFSYSKYEYRRDLPLYQSILSYLNSSYITNIMSKMLKTEIIGVSDLFISVFYKDNFLSTHDDRGLGHYAYISFLSQDWDFDKNGGSLNFNCQTRGKWRESCYEAKLKFNQNVFFKVWPEIVPHFVKTVSVDKPRIAITGFYFTADPEGIYWDFIQEETGYGPVAMLSFLTILITGCYAATINNPLTPAQMAQVLQLIGASDSGLACNISSINPALLLAAAGAAQGGTSPFDMDKITQQLSQYASLMYPAAYQACQSLQLSSSECLQDCIMYNHPITIFVNTSSPTFKTQLLRIFAWYSVSGSPIGWYDTGNPDQCDYFHGQYCFTPLINKYDESEGVYPSIKVPHGCCVPGSCTGDDAAKVVADNVWCFKAFNASYGGSLASFGQTDLEVKPFCEIPPRDTTSFGFIMVVFIFALFVFLVVMASAIYQYRMQFKAIEVNNVQALNANLNPADVDQVNNVNTKQRILENSGFLKIFSIQSIWDKYTAVRPDDKSDMNFLDGIRVYSMSWVVLGHAYMFVIGSSNAMALAPFLPNAPSADEHEYVVNKFSNIFIQYAFYSVDSFFWLSGFLAAFSIYRNVSKLGDPCQVIKRWYAWIPMSYFQRYLRLAPMMFFAVLIQWKISDQLPGGPHTLTRGENEYVCSESWWRVMLMIDNLWLTKDGGNDALGCMGQLWYIQCDFQMFLLLPWLVLIFVKNKRAGIAASLVPFIVCLIIRFYMGFHYHFSANVILPDLTPIHGGNEMNQSYFKAWTRMATYFIGVTTMFVMITINEHYKKNGRKFVLFTYTYYIVMGLALFSLGSLVIWPYNDIKDAPNGRWGETANEIYFVLSKPVWGIGLSLLAFALRYIDETERKMISIIKQFLSLEIYQPLGKLTYIMFLLHLAVYSWWSGDNVMPSYYTDWFVVYLFIGTWTVTASISLIFHLFMETPINSMVTILLAKMRKCRFRKNRGNRGDRSGENQNEIPLSNVSRSQYNKLGNNNNFSILKTGNIQQDAI